MAYEENAEYITSLNAAVDLSADTNQFRLVRVEAAGTVGLADSQTDANIIGVLQNKPKAGERAKIAPLKPGSILKMLAGGAVAKGAVVYPVAAANDGRVDDLADANRGVQVGIALDAAGAAGEVISVLVINRTYSAT